MDFQHHSLSTTYIIFLIIISTFIYFLLPSLRTTSSNKRLSQKLPPGPWKLPIIGNLHNLIGSLPHHSLRELSKKYGPIMHLQIGEISTIIVSSPRMAREILKTHDISFAQRPQLLATKIVAHGDMNIAFSPYGEYWKQMKMVLVSELLTAKRVESFSVIREEELAGLVQSIRLSSSAVQANPRPVINLTERLLKLTVGITCRAAFGNKCKDEAALISILNEAALLAGGFGLADLFPSKKLLQAMCLVRARLEKIRAKSDEIIQAIIDEHIENRSRIDVEPKKEDFLDALLKLLKSNNNSRHETSITIDHIKALICDVFAGGTHTASTTIEWAMAELMKNPRAMKKVQAEIRRVLRGKKRIHEKDIIFEPSYQKAVIKETLRLHPPAPLLPRECREPCRVVDEYEITTKTRVIVNAWAIGRDPEYWDQPESFLPERFIDSSVNFRKESCDNFAYIPFGAGRRMCPGISSGLASVEIALTHLLYHFDWELPPGTERESLDMAEAFGASVGRKRDLCLTAIPFVEN